MNRIKYEIRKRYRHFKYWLIKKMCTEEEWKTLRNIRAGYYGYYGYTEKKIDILPLEFKFELDDASHEFLHSADGQREYDAKWGATRQMLRNSEDIIAEYVKYTESYDEKRKVWVCQAELDIVGNESDCY